MERVLTLALLLSNLDFLLESPLVDRATTNGVWEQNPVMYGLYDETCLWPYSP